jgi:hypothetical protein
VDKERRCQRHSNGGVQQEGAARHSGVGASEPTNLEGHQLGETEAAQGESLHTTREPGEEASQPRPHEEFCEAPGELMLQGGEHTGSPGVGGGDCSGAAPDELGHREPHQHSGMSPSTHVPGDWSVGRGGPADTAPDEHPEDGAEHRDPGDHNHESKELQMVADGSLLGRPITGGSGTCAMGDSQETRHLVSDSLLSNFDQSKSHFVEIMQAHNYY